MFVDYISEGIRKEYEKEGIVVQVRQTLSHALLILSLSLSLSLSPSQNVRPGIVATSMAKSEGIKPNLFVMSPEFFARSALNTLGIQRETNGCLSHAIQVRKKK